jgi:hypothetical protein
VESVSVILNVLERYVMVHVYGIGS